MPVAAPPSAAAVPVNAWVERLQNARTNGEQVEGKIIGWNDGGFHVVVEGQTAFCPRSEVEEGHAQEPASYVDQTFPFVVIRIDNNGKKVVVSRAAALRQGSSEAMVDLQHHLKSGEPVTGTVQSIADYGAFVDLGGIRGLLHVSEMSRERVQHPGDVVKEGEEVTVKVIKLDQKGGRISLSIKALLPDPWKDVAKKFPVGAEVSGKVERTASFGVFVELEPGLTGLMPSSALSLPRDASVARAFPPGKEVDIQIMSLDLRRRRLSLAPQGSQVEGSRTDFQDYQTRQNEDTPETSFNAMAAALRKFQAG